MADFVDTWQEDDPVEESRPQPRHAAKSTQQGAPRKRVARRPDARRVEASSADACHSDVHSADALRPQVRSAEKATWKFHLKEAASYLIVASMLVAAMTVFGELAPFLPTFVIPIVLLLYAVPATLGATYSLVVRRYYNQNRYTKGGVPGRYKSHWTIWMTAFFAFSLFSGCTFLLGAPSWSGGAWVLVWGSVLVYYVIYLVVYRWSARNFDSTYCKSKAMAYSAIITAVIVCVVYSLIPGANDAGLTGDPAQFIDELKSRSLYFEHSSCMLFRELDKVVTYTDFLTKYRWGYTGLKAVAIIAVKVAISASVFYGFANLIGCCVLKWNEASAVFRSLPAFGEGLGSQGLLRRYVACLVVVWALFAGSFVLVDAKVGESQKEGEPTLVDRGLEEATEWLGYAVDGLVEAKEESEMFLDFENKCEAITDDYELKLQTLMADYYDVCRGNVGQYLAWYGGVGGGFSRTFMFLGEGFAVDQFRKNVTDSVDRSELDATLAAYVGELNAAWEEYQAKRAQNEHADTSGIYERSGNPFAGLDAELILWPDWESDEGSRIAREVLLASGAGGDRDQAEQLIAGFIDGRQQIAEQQIQSWVLVAREGESK